MKKYFNCAILFALSSAAASFYVAFKTNGYLFSTVSSDQMIRFGALDGDTLKIDEAWRLVTSQLIHQKQLHMVFNVLLIWILGTAIEREIGSIKFSIFYWLTGISGIIASVIVYPEYVSSGSSQILMGLFAGILILKWQTLKISKAVFYLTIIGLLAQLGLDVYVNRYPKAGHIIGFFAGGIFAFVLLNNLRKSGLGNIN